MIKLSGSLNAKILKLEVDFSSVFNPCSMFQSSVEKWLKLKVNYVAVKIYHGYIARSKIKS